MARSRAKSLWLVAALSLSSPGIAVAGKLTVGELKYPNAVKPVFTVGVQGKAPAALSDPRGTAFAPDGTLFIVDSGNNRVAAFKPSVSRGRISYELARSSDAVLNNPRDVAISGSEIFVADAGNHRVVVFDLDLKVLRTFGAHGARDGDLSDPQGIDAIGGRVLVADTGNRRLQEFDTSGGFVRSFTPQDQAFKEPSDVTIASNGDVYAADTHSNRIVHFSQARGVTSWGAYGSYVGQFAEPIGVEASGPNIYVADLVNHRLQVFDHDGKFLYTFARHPTKPREGNGRVHYPISVSHDPRYGTIVVCESFENRCQIFSEATILKKYRAVNDTAWWEKYPRFHYGRRLKITRTASMRADLGGEVMTMSEPDVNRVVVFDVSGDAPMRLSDFGGVGDAEHQFNGPHGVGVMPGGYVVVTDSFNNKVKLFDLKGLKARRVEVLAALEKAKTERPRPFFSSRRTAVAGGYSSITSLRDQLPAYPLPFVRSWGRFGTGADPYDFNTPSGGASVGTVDIGLDQLPGRPFEPNLPPTGIPGGPDRLPTVPGGLPTPPGGPPRAEPDRVPGAPGATPAPPGATPAGPDLPPNAPPSGPGAGPTTRPAADRIWVSDTRNHRIKLFNEDGTYAGVTIGGHGTGPGELNLPTDLVTDMDNRILYVVEAFNQRGSAFNSSTGKFLFNFGSQGVTPGKFMAPSGVAVDRQGYIYVTDQGTQKVSRWKPIKGPDGDTSGAEFDMWFGDYNSKPGGFLYPQGIAIDSKDRVYVINFGLHKGEMFTRDGQHIRSFGEEVLQPVD